jgi:hypothetical protein
MSALLQIALLGYSSSTAKFLAMAYPIGFRPSQSENQAISRAMRELQCDRSTILRTALHHWLSTMYRQGIVSKAPALRD